MSNRITIAFALAAGFIGGAGFHYLFTPMPVRAQTQTPPPLEIRARKFVLVDENGTALGVFGFRSDGSPDVQIGDGKGYTASARWGPVFRKKSVLPDLKPSGPLQNRQPGGPH